MAENWYERHLLPYLIDFACAAPAVRALRAQLVTQASGRVLEIGLGTGLNLRHYDAAQVRELIALEPATAMHRLAQKRIAQTRLHVELIGLSAEQIPLADASVDTVVITYTLCSIVDPLQALREMRRVLVPGGRLLFSEHGRAPEARVRVWQDRLTPYWSHVAGGCHLNRDVPELLRGAGFACLDLRTQYLPGPRPFAYNYAGTAMAVA